MPVTIENLHDVLGKGEAALTPEQIDALKHVIAAGGTLINVILHKVPLCGDQQAAIRKVREAIFTAGEAVQLQGLV